MGVVAIPSLISAMEDASNNIRKNSAYILGNMGYVSINALPALIKALEDSDIGVRYYAIEALGKIGSANDKNTIPALIKFLKDSDQQIQTATIEALEKITHKKFGNDYAKWTDWWEKNKPNKEE